VVKGITCLAKRARLLKGERRGKKGEEEREEGRKKKEVNRRAAEGAEESQRIFNAKEQRHRDKESVEVSFHQTESLGYNSLGHRPRYIVDMFRRLKACLIVYYGSFIPDNHFAILSTSSPPNSKFTITQAFSLLNLSTAYLGRCPRLL
jgi:hypothetical protein